MSLRDDAARHLEAAGVFSTFAVALLALLSAISGSLAAEPARWTGEAVVFTLPDLPGVSVQGMVPPTVGLTLLGVEIISGGYPGHAPSYQLAVRNDADQPITAWSLRIHTFRNGERVPGSTGYSSDSVNLLNAPAIEPDESPILEPGEVEALDLPIAPGRSKDADQLSYRVEITSVVFEDTSFAGDPESAAQLFLRRGRSYPGLVAESSQLETAAGLPATLALDELESFAERTPRPVDSSSGRRRMANPVSRVDTDAEGNIHRMLEEAHQEPTRAPALVRELLAISHGERQLVETYTPSAFLDPHGPVGEGRRLGRSGGRDGYERSDGSCSLISSKVARTQSCSSGLIRITEDWTFTCQPYTGHGGSDRLLATGECLAGEECFPIIDPVSEWEDLSTDTIYWNRSWSNRIIYVPTLRCDEAEFKTLTKTCPCPEQEETVPGSDPEPAPSDGSCTSDSECSSPILLDLAMNGLHLTGLADPVSFDIDADGTEETLAWTAAGSDDALLALDRNGNGRIDHGGELFGDHTAQGESEVPNGYAALAVFDQPEAGGNADGWISSADEIFSSLILWQDLDHDGASEPGELTPLEESPVRRVGLEVFETRRQDRHGNWLRWSSLVGFDRARKLAAVDVLFRTMAASSQSGP